MMTRHTNPSPWPALARVRRFLSRKSGKVSPAIVDALPPRVRPLLELEEFRKAGTALGPANLQVSFPIEIGFLATVDFVRDALSLGRAEYLRRRTLRYLLGDLVLVTASHGIRDRTVIDCLTCDLVQSSASESSPTEGELLTLSLTRDEVDALHALALLDGVPPERLLANALNAELLGRTTPTSGFADQHWKDGWQSTALTGNDEALKVWLPQIVWDAMLICAKEMGVDASEYVRRRLARYLWGDRVLTHLFALVQAQTNSKKVDIRFSRKISPQMLERERRRIYRAPELGTNAVAAKFWISSQMRSAVETLCARAGDIAPSKLVREILAGDVLGRATLPERIGLLALPTHGADWDAGRTVPMVEVSPDRIEKLSYYETSEEA
jgi:hypothetical protein